MNKSSENIYLDTLLYGEEKLVKRKPVERKDLKQYLVNKGYKFNTKEEKRLLAVLGKIAFNMSPEEPSNRKYYLTLEGYFKLLDYRDLSDARKSAREARLFTLIAIGISLLTLIVSVIFSIAELNQSTTISNDQFESIEHIEKKLEDFELSRRSKFKKNEMID